MAGIDEEQLIETLSGLIDHRLKPGVDDNDRFPILYSFKTLTAERKLELFFG